VMLEQRTDRRLADVENRQDTHSNSKTASATCTGCLAIVEVI
jgi:hypothetical protein